MKNAETHIPEMTRLDDEMLQQVNGGCVGVISTLFDMAVFAATTFPASIACKQLYKQYDKWKKQKKNKQNTAA